jgi:hypothetical protein
MRLRQHIPNWHYESIDEFLIEADPEYRKLVTAA